MSERYKAQPISIIINGVQPWRVAREGVPIAENCTKADAEKIAAALNYYEEGLAAIARMERRRKEHE